MAARLPRLLSFLGARDCHVMSGDGSSAGMLKGLAHGQVVRHATASRNAAPSGHAERPSGPVEAQPAAHLVFVHDRVGVAVRDAGVIGQPVGALVAAQERGAGFESVEPLSEVAPGHDRDARNETTVQIR